MTQTAAPAGKRARDPDRTCADILDVATRMFAERGFTGARIDEIAAGTQTTKRMIYYYFGDKEGLYVAVLEKAYGRIRALEQSLDVDHLPPADALRRLAELTFDHHEAQPDFVRLVSVENIHHAEHLRQSRIRADLAAPALGVLRRILDRGRAEGAFRADVDALDVHMVISSYCIFRGANRFTFEAIFGRDLLDPGRREHYRGLLGDLVLNYVSTRAE